MAGITEWVTQHSRFDALSSGLSTDQPERQPHAQMVPCFKLRLVQTGTRHVSFSHNRVSPFIRSARGVRTGRAQTFLSWGAVLIQYGWKNKAQTGTCKGLSRTGQGATRQATRDRSKTRPPNSKLSQVLFHLRLFPLKPSRAHPLTFSDQFIIRPFKFLQQRPHTRTHESKDGWIRVWPN